MLGAKTKVAYFGELHPQILEMFDLQEPVVGFEVFVNTIPAAKGLKKDFTLLSPYQPVERDFSFILDTHIPGEKLLQLIQKLDKNLITSVSVFDVYQGKEVPEGKKSVALSVRLEPRENTLTEAEITNLSNKIIENAQKILGAELRS
jgi:phenylalanyl-tRNA synthetase beta chain